MQIPHDKREATNTIQTKTIYKNVCLFYFIIFSYIVVDITHMMTGNIIVTTEI